MTITSEPSGAKVEINAVPAGVTPMTLQITPVGLGFTVTVTKNGFMKWTVQSFSTAQPYSLHAQLRESEVESRDNRMSQFRTGESRAVHFNSEELLLDLDLRTQIRMPRRQPHSARRFRGLDPNRARAARQRERILADNFPRTSQRQRNRTRCQRPDVAVLIRHQEYHARGIAPVADQLLIVRRNLKIRVLAGTGKCQRF